MSYLLVFLFSLRWLFRTVLQVSSPFIDVFVYGFLIAGSGFFRYQRYFPLLFVLSFICAFTNADALHLVLIVFLCMMSRKAHIEKLALVNTLMGVVTIGTVLYLLHIGVLQDESYIDQGSYQVRERHTMGLGYNLFSVLVLSVLLNAYVYLHDKLNKYLLAALCFAVSYFTFQATMSNTSFIGGCSLALFHLMYSNGFFRALLNNRLVVYGAPLYLLGLTFGLAILSDIWPDINDIITARPHLFNEYLQKVTLFNFFLGDDRMYDFEAWVDSSHLHMLFEAGIWFYFFFYTIYLKAMKYYFYRLERDEEYTSPLIPVFFAFMVAGLTENTMVEVTLIGNATPWMMLFIFAEQYEQLKRNRQKCL